MNAHTPGPWTSFHGSNKHQVLTAPDGTARGQVVVADCGGPEKDANARLIAAAPDLLEALTEIVADLQFSEVPQHRNLVVMARAALAKATGE